jgi:hypothetical protein
VKLENKLPVARYWLPVIPFAFLLVAAMLFCLGAFSQFATPCTFIGDLTEYIYLFSGKFAIHIIALDE